MLDHQSKYPNGRHHPLYQYLPYNLYSSLNLHDFYIYFDDDFQMIFDMNEKNYVGTWVHF